eukprot:2124990-Amphidinium_carterae.1
MREPSLPQHAFPSHTQGKLRLSPKDRRPCMAGIAKCPGIVPHMDQQREPKSASTTTLPQNT